MNKIEQNRFLLVFISNNYAVALYNKFLKQGLEIKIIPTPCSISSGCSQAILFEEKDMDIIKFEAARNSLCVKGIYKIIKKEDKTKYIDIYRF